MSEETLRKLALQVRNWGRWGTDDEVGTLNYITPDAIAGACRPATAGKVFALGIPLQREGPQSGTRQRFNPIHTMFRDGGDQPKTAAEVATLQGYGGSDDWIVMPLQCVTQWDSLAHVFYEGKMYNGLRRNAGDLERGGQEQHRQDQEQDRRARRAARRRALQGGAGARAGLRHHGGGSRCHRRRPAHGRPARRYRGDPHRAHDALSGPERLASLRSRQRPRRLRAHRAVDARAPDRRGGERQLRGGGAALGAAAIPQPVPHLRHPEHGPDAGRDLFLEELAADCAADGRYEFLLVAPPLPVTRAVGTPINPYAIK